MPWYICCLGLEQKSSHSAHTEFLCYCFLPKQGLNFPLLSSCKNHGLSLSWYTANLFISMAACSLQRREKDWFFFEKSGMSSNRTSSEAKYNSTSFSLGSGRNPGLCFIELSLQAGFRPVNVQESVGEKILLLMRTAPTFPPLGSGFKIQTCKSTELLVGPDMELSW